MDRRHVLLAIVALLTTVVSAPLTTEAGASSDSLLELAAGGGPSVGFGFGVSPLHWEPIASPLAGFGSAAGENATLTDLEPRGRALSLDVKLRWPGAEPTTGLQPYVVLGPALFVDQTHELPSLTAIPGDPILRVGAKVGAGFNWRLGKDATLFGSYDVTTTSVDGFTSRGTKTPATSAPGGYDILYGVRFRY
jgi:hypothetical protein